MTEPELRGRFSVAMCTYNGARFVREQLASIATQTLPPAEIVVCDDASTDDTPAIVEQFARASRIEVRFHINPTRLGSTRNFERAIGLCGGSFIALADQDDVWRTDKLAVIGSAFAAAPEVGMVFSDAEVTDADLRSKGYGVWQSVTFTRALQARFRRGDGFAVLMRGNKVTGATMAFDARFRELVLPIPDGAYHDEWIALLICAVAKGVPLSERLVQYRQHDRNQVGSSGHDVASMVRKAIRPGADVYADAADVNDQFIRRLCAQRRFQVSPDLVAALTQRGDFLRWRATLPRGRLTRLARASAAFASGRYRRFANGWRSFASDLVRPD